MQLEVGKTYLTRGRTEVKIVSVDYSRVPYIFKGDNGEAYKPEGLWGTSFKSDRNLIAEKEMDYSMAACEKVMVKSDTVRKLEDGYKFIVVDTNSGRSLGSHKTSEAAQLAARKALTQDSSFYIFQAVAKVSPKPIDADVEDLTV